MLPRDVSDVLHVPRDVSVIIDVPRDVSVIIDAHVMFVKLTLSYRTVCCL